MNNNYCNKCGKCCSEIVVDFAKKVMYRDGVQTLSDDFTKLLIPTRQKNNITICKCKFLKDNLCTNPQKPEECEKFPDSPFAFLPDNCGYYGIIFNKNEHARQKIRKLKEEILYYEAKLKQDKSLIKVIERHKAYIDKFKIYGSDNW